MGTVTEVLAKEVKGKSNHQQGNIQLHLLRDEMMLIKIAKGNKKMELVDKLFRLLNTNVTRINCMPLF